MTRYPNHSPNFCRYDATMPPELNILTHAVWQHTVSLRDAFTHHRRGGGSIMPVYRNGPLQIEAITFQPFLHIPEHTHPNVSSYEFLLHGGAFFTIGGHQYHVSDQHAICCPLIGVPRNEAHRAWSGPHGTFFFSIQFWHDCAPESIIEDWQGSTVYIEPQTNQNHPTSPRKDSPCVPTKS